MPALSPRCKTCKCPYLPDIERMYFVEHKSPEAISQWLKETYKIKISTEALRSHLKNHSNVPAEALRQYEDQKAATIETAGKVVDELAILDRLIQDELEAHDLVKAWISDLFKPPDKPGPFEKIELPYIPMSLVTMSQGTIAEIRQLIKTKNELLDGDLSGKNASSLASAMKKAHEHRIQRLGGAGGGDKK